LCNHQHISRDHGGKAGAADDEAAPGAEPIAGVGSGGRATGPPGGVRRRGAEAAGDPDGVPEPPGVRDAAEAGGGRVRLRPPLRRPHHPLRVGRRLRRHHRRRCGRAPPPPPMSDDRPSPVDLAADH